MSKSKEDSEKFIKKHCTIGCCGIDCALCPRYYTDGTSKCPGCGGPDFGEKHPACSFLNCCVNKKGLEVCGECKEFPCRKYENENVKKDSFVTHGKMFENQGFIKKFGIKKLFEAQKVRVCILENMLGKYNDGRNKSLYCRTAALLDVQILKKAMERAEFEIKSANILEDDFANKGKILRNILKAEPLAKPFS